MLALSALSGSFRGRLAQPRTLNLVELKDY
jgi:hypothetical protein